MQNDVNPMKKHVFEAVWQEKFVNDSVRVYIHHRSMTSIKSKGDRT